MTADFFLLAKPRIALLVMLTAALGYALAGGEGLGLWVIVGTGLASAACGCLNQALEGPQDALMTRTKSRPVAAGRVPAARAGALGLILSAAGLAVLWRGCGPLAAWLTAATIFCYAALYTPLKRYTPQTTWLGAAAGAAPPLIGWAAARGSLSAQAWVLFGIQFLWQIPHFLSLFWLYRDQYEGAGFRLTSPRPTTGAQIAMHSFTVLPAALAPVFFGMAGKGYGVAALLLSLAYLLFGLKASWTMTATDSRRLFLASLAYLPLLFASLLIGGS